MSVAIVMGSESDFGVVMRAGEMLRNFGVEHEYHVISAHRSPDKAREFAISAERKGVRVIIAAAGKAAHLGGILAAYTSLPVIGVPIKSAAFGGLDALLSTVQMPTGVPVAAVAVDGAENAAILAVQILALENQSLRVQLVAYKEKLAAKVDEVEEKIQNAEL
ncbi:MAG: 5-(carboxyamino)imidazole ribonucleotide mutase [Clostridiales bacterium]|nr:5-(carboxyamino)imidazole ribonucleotide mutase [Clostridiales bacterium]